MAKARTPVPEATAARILFTSDRTCCVCRQAKKPVQIHHLDDSPANHDSANLVVLCFDCHRDAHISGGFDRKLDREQIALYRDNWLKIVAASRLARDPSDSSISTSPSRELELATSIAEIYRERDDFQRLALHYDRIGNSELRDKYIEKVLEDNHSPSNLVFLRRIQGRLREVPADVVNSVIESTADPTSRAVIFSDLGRCIDATKEFLKIIEEALEDDRPFTSAFYIRTIISKGLPEELFLVALEDARSRGDLWWQVRSYQELGWVDELRVFLLDHASEIRRVAGYKLQALLADAEGHPDEALELEKAIARDFGKAHTREEEGKSPRIRERNRRR